MSATNIANLSATTDENGALRVSSVAAGLVLNAPASIAANQLGLPAASDKIQIAVVTVATGGVGPLTALTELKLRCDENGSILCNDTDPGAILTGPPTPGAHARACVDSHGYLMVNVQAIGAASSPLTPLANLRLRTDENGSLIVGA